MDKRPDSARERYCKALPIRGETQSNRRRLPTFSSRVLTARLNRPAGAELLAEYNSLLFAFEGNRENYRRVVCDV
jgi:hypothetical protein